MTLQRQCWECLCRHKKRALTNEELARMLGANIKSVRTATKSLAFCGHARKVGVVGMFGLWEAVPGTGGPSLNPYRDANLARYHKGKRTIAPKDERVNYPMPECELALVWADPVRVPVIRIHA